MRDGSKGRSASSRTKSGLLFTLCGFLSLGCRTPQGVFHLRLLYPKSVFRVVVIENICEFVIENVGNVFPFLIILDSLKNVLAVFVNTKL